MSYYSRIEQVAENQIQAEGRQYHRKSIRYYRERKEPKKGKPILPQIGDVFVNAEVAKPQVSKRSLLSAEGKKRFDKILNSQVSNFIFRNFPWDKTKKPRELWIAVDEVEENVMLTGFESYNSWYKVFKSGIGDNRSNTSTATEAGTGFWLLAINKLMSGGYHSDSGINLFALDELLRKIEEQYIE